MRFRHGLDFGSRPMLRRFAPRSVWLLLATTLLVSACADAPPDDGPDDGQPARSDARAILDSARTAAGADVLAGGARVSFTFRGDRFRLRHRADGGFSYARLSRDSLGRRVEDVLTSSGTLRRRIDGRSASLDSAARRRIETAVNSVAHFALLPFPLGDPAVQPRYAGTDTLRGTPYHRIAVRFRQQGGGRDWQDRFLYWFDQRDFSMDYLAYAYGLGNGEDYGTRFRDAFNVRRVGGVRFADYRNYPLPDSLPPDQLARYGRLFDADSLRRVSTVALDSVRVE
ncbi:MAG: hypothetical protein BRD37_03555 [Bacteroidetes bacterium QH_8_67_23]|nr:MAG: hypothetical protein BRD37_03555 [Bacteroidetes bacterium QH_8_67_23]